MHPLALLLVIAAADPPAHDVYRFPARQVALLHLDRLHHERAELERERSAAMAQETWDWNALWRHLGEFQRVEYRITCWQTLADAWGECREDRRREELLGYDYRTAEMPGMAEIRERR